jgi:hypothetical protein
MADVAGTFFVRIPDPGPDVEALFAVTSIINAHPAVAIASTIPYGVTPYPNPDGETPPQQPASMGRYEVVIVFDHRFQALASFTR